MTQTADLIHKMADFFTSEEFFEKGEDARLELSPDDVRCMNEVIKACGNAISRQAAIDIIGDIDITNGFEPIFSGRQIQALLSDLSPVIPQPKTGQWINGDDKCPCCGKSKFEGLDADIYADWQPKYCPNCGTKMGVKE